MDCPVRKGFVDSAGERGDAALRPQEPRTRRGQKRQARPSSRNRTSDLRMSRAVCAVYSPPLYQLSYRRVRAARAGSRPFVPIEGGQATARPQAPRALGGLESRQGREESPARLHARHRASGAFWPSRGGAGPPGHGGGPSSECPLGSWAPLPSRLHGCPVPTAFAGRMAGQGCVMRGGLVWGGGDWRWGPGGGAGGWGGGGGWEGDGGQTGSKA